MKPLAFALLLGIALAGIVPDGAPIPLPGQPGAPHRALSTAEQEQFLRGRAVFDRDFLGGAGVGPVFNGDSCRACHVDPVIAGSGGRDVQVQRPQMADGMGGFVSPPETGELAQTHSMVPVAREEIPGTVAFVEERNSPTLLGLGLVQSVSDATILARQDPTDADSDGIRGVAHVLPGGRVGKLGWKANIPDLRGFLRDAMANELGITVPPDASSPFGITADGDAVQDPELSSADLEDLLFFMEMLDFPAKGAQQPAGEALFTSIGCAKCHAPVMDGVEIFSDLLLHDVQPPGFVGVTQGAATSGLYRTAPLRGVRDTGPYFHDGASETIEDAIRRHDGEALAVRQAFEALTPAERSALLAFLASL